MKLKALLLALFVAGLAVAGGIASPAAVGETTPTPTPTPTPTTSTDDGSKAKGKDAAQARRKAKAAARLTACRPARKIVLGGEFVAAATGGFTLKAMRGNKLGKPWKDRTATVLLDDKSKLHGKKRALADFAAGDRIVVQGYACKADAVAGSMLARRVLNKGPKPAAGEASTTTTTATVPTPTP
jgi:hypothetical protein